MNASDLSSQLVLTRHLVLFLDFLGISEGARSWDAQRIARFIPLLQFLARSRAPFSINGEPLKDGSFKFTAHPEISSFSDNIVASYPIVDGSLTPADQVTMYLGMMTGLVAQIAFHALNMSVLVRGGITFGLLYHSGGVVFGPAMVDAYRLESKVANYPRVVISPEVYNCCGDGGVLDKERSASLLQDNDGIRHLNYFSKMLTNTPTEADRTRTFALASGHIATVAAQFEEAGKLNELAKWRWFQAHYGQFAGPR